MGNAGYAHLPGNPRIPRESRENSKGTLRYEACTEKWMRTKCEKGYASTNERGAAAHAEAHTRAEQKQQKRKEQLSDNTKICPTKCR